MGTEKRRQALHDLDVTVQVGKNGLDAVVDELDDQLSDTELVKVRFHRAARAGASTADLAADLADRVNASGFETRGHTAVIER
jgi:RNA-binding protein